MTRNEAIQRLHEIAQEISEVTNVLEQGWGEVSGEDPTQAFLAKCGGWEDNRKPEEIIAEIYAARTASNGGLPAFREGSP